MRSPQHILMIDNYDSFTYNLVQAFLALGARVDVYRNDAITIPQAEAIGFSHLVISPGPGGPKDAGVSMDFIGHFSKTKPVLGVCLGHQAMAELFAGDGAVKRAPRLMHGKSSTIIHDGKGIYKGLPSELEVGRYHSLCVQNDRVPKDFIISSQTSVGEIMGIRHISKPIEGVQFHPESVLTPTGPQMLANFVNLTT